MLKVKNKNLRQTVISYFKMEWKVLLAVTVSGLIYNLGLLAGPWFEGKMAGLSGGYPWRQGRIS